MTTTLTRTLKLPSLVLFGLAYLTPIIVLGIFGIIAETTGGAAPAAYLVALVAMLFTAHSYGRMAIAYPVAGSAYTYVRRSIDPRVGFLVGWAVLLDYLFLPMVIWLIGGSYLTAQFPGIPIGVWIVGFIVVTTLLNILGIKVADKANYVLMAFQLLVLVFFVALAIGNVVSANGAGGLASGQPFFNASSMRMRERTDTVMAGMLASFSLGSAPSSVWLQRKPMATWTLAAISASATAPPLLSSQGSLTVTMVSPSWRIFASAPATI